MEKGNTINKHLKYRGNTMRRRRPQSTVRQCCLTNMPDCEGAPFLSAATKPASPSASPEAPGSLAWPPVTRAVCGDGNPRPVRGQVQAPGNRAERPSAWLCKQHWFSQQEHGIALTKENQEYPENISHSTQHLGSSGSLLLPTRLSGDSSLEERREARVSGHRLPTSLSQQQAPHTARALAGGTAAGPARAQGSAECRVIFSTQSTPEKSSASRQARREQAATAAASPSSSSSSSASLAAAHHRGTTTAWLRSPRQSVLPAQHSSPPTASRHRCQVRRLRPTS